MLYLNNLKSMFLYAIFHAESKENAFDTLKRQKR
jgi:hypothetical protein